MIMNADALEEELQRSRSISTSYSSFIRQLNFYNFKKVGSLRKLKQVTYIHPHFHRDLPQGLHMVIRSRRVRNGTPQQAGNDDDSSSEDNEDSNLMNVG